MATSKIQVVKAPGSSLRGTNVPNSDASFDLRRVKLLSNVKEVPSYIKGIVYWMSRDARVQDNWAMLFAQRLALKNRVALHVCYCLLPKFLDATIRHFRFLLSGLREVEAELKSLNIEFHLLRGEADKVLCDFVKKNYIGAVVTDFSPLRTPLSWVDSFRRNLSQDVPFWQVDAHNIVPLWVASDHLEAAAYTIRGKIKGQLKEFLTPFPPVSKHPFTSSEKAEGNVVEFDDGLCGKRAICSQFLRQSFINKRKKPVDWGLAESSLQVDRSVAEVAWAQPGTAAAHKMLQHFISNGLRLYGTMRNEPNVKAQSNLSPWIHFGHISVQRCALAIQELRSKYPESVDSWLEQAIVRRELADNFCYYNPNYDNFNGADDWARKTLDNHRKDKRQFKYRREDFEAAQTHDDLWNASQLQMMKEGKMHGFLRMYWAKKMLEWSESPESALADAVYLNDRYNLDGRDPNGYVGIMWSMCGVHDHAFPERQVLGTIRWMSYEASKRKFDVPAFVARYGAKKYRYIDKS